MRKNLMLPALIAAGAMVTAGITAYLRSRSGRVLRMLDTHISPDKLEENYTGNCIVERVINLVASRFNLDIAKQRIYHITTVSPNTVFITIVGEGYRHAMMYSMTDGYLRCDQYRYKQ